MVNTTGYTDTTGEVTEMPLNLVRLRTDVVPSILHSCPAYISSPNENTSREAPDEQRTCREAAALRDATSKSIETQQVEEDKNKI